MRTVDMSLKSIVKESKVVDRYKKRTYKYGHPRESEGTILGDMERILLLLEENNRLKRERYGKQ